MMLPVPNRAWPLLLAAMTVPLLAACSNDKTTTWQGYCLLYTSDAADD